MVGVHGGSKGCVRCRKRKVKCDETRPTCRRCEKGGYDCGGYRDLFQFDSRSATKGAGRSQELVSRIQPIWTIAPATPTLTEASWSPSPPPDSDVELDLISSYQLSVPRFLNLRPFSEDFCVSYTNSHLMKGSGDSQSNWAIPGITSFSKNHLVRDCILALSFSFFGKQYSDKTTLGRGVSLYGSTLGRLNKILGDSTESQAVPTLESIMVLTLYEVLMGTSLKSFVAHVLGLEALLKMVGPEAVSDSRQALELLESSRPVIVSACTLSVKATILSAPEWKTIPWSKGLKKKSDLQLLYDVMVDQPGLILHVVDPVSPGLRLRTSMPQDVDGLYTRACQTLAGYDSWFVDWNSRHSGHMLEFAPIWAPTDWLQSNDDLPWDKVWHFSAIAIAQAYTAYQAGIIVCTRLVYSLEQSGLLKMEHSTYSRESELEHAAIEIGRSVEWLLAEQRRAAGGLYLLMPSRCAWKTFPHDSAARRWMLAATRDIGKAHRAGWGLANPMARPLTTHFKNGSIRIDVAEADA